jgi:hypothetical protein
MPQSAVPLPDPRAATVPSLNGSAPPLPSEVIREHHPRPAGPHGLRRAITKMFPHRHPAPPVTPQ